MAKQRWVFVVQALDKPGTLTAVAAVFSNRGVSLEGILGSGIAPMTPEGGRLVISFCATQPKQQLLHRALERLSSIFHVDVYTSSDERLRAIAVAKLDPATPLPAAVDYRAETILQTDSERMVMLTGTPSRVEDALEHFREQQQLLDLVTSYIAI
ncbi:MAG: hypothetical protein AAGE59_21070 [Cyanobacteria bacterium P01_F01_bin.86]